MSVIEKAFQQQSSSEYKGFIPFITAGDPDLATTLDLMRLLAERGSTVIELGIPFSDPMADGPVIQASSQRALEKWSVTIDDVLELVREFRTQYATPIVVFGYLNPFFAYGLDEFGKKAQEVGVNGILITDVIDNEFTNISETLAKYQLDLITLVSPTTEAGRMAGILKHARGFVYAISMRGVTGSDLEGTDEAQQLVEKIRAITALPVAVGFGISTSADFQRVRDYADAAVVGSALVKRIASANENSDAVKAAREFLDELFRE